MNKKTIFITGAAGMIAYSLIENLVSTYGENLSIIGLDYADFTKNNQYSSERINNLKKYDNFEYIDINLKHHLMFKILLEQYQPQVIIHLAAKVNVGQGNKNPKNTLDNNQNSFVNILESVRLYNKDIPIIYASSSSVYGKNTNINSKETDTLQPLSAYGLSKLINEQTAQIYTQCYELTLIGLRFFTVYGNYPRKDMFIYKVIDSIINQNSLTIYNNGQMKRDFTYAPDIAKIIQSLLNLGLENKLKGHYIFNVGKGKSNSLEDVVNICEKYFNNRANIQYSTNIPIYDPLITLCDNTELINFLNHSISFTNLEEGIQQLALWYKKSFS